MNQIEIILSYASTIIIFLVSSITYVVKYIKRVKELKIMNDSKLLESELERLMILAEQFMVDGNTKESFVLDRLKYFAQELKIDFKYDEIHGKILNLIQLTKNINYFKTEDQTVKTSSLEAEKNDLELGAKSPFRTYINDHK